MTLLKQRSNSWRLGFGLREISLGDESPTWVADSRTEDGPDKWSVSDRCLVRAPILDLERFTLDCTPARGVQEMPSDHLALALNWTARDDLEDDRPLYEAIPSYAFTGTYVPGTDSTTPGYATGH